MNTVIQGQNQTLCSTYSNGKFIKTDTVHWPLQLLHAINAFVSNSGLQGHVQAAYQNGSQEASAQRCVPIHKILSYGHSNQIRQLQNLLSFVMMSKIKQPYALFTNKNVVFICYFICLYPKNGNMIGPIKSHAMFSKGNGIL